MQGQVTESTVALHISHTVYIDRQEGSTVWKNTAVEEASTFPPPGATIPAYETRALARALTKSVQKAFQSPDTRAEFEAWYLERYGKPYQWNKKGGPAP